MVNVSKKVVTEKKVTEKVRGIRYLESIFETNPSPNLARGIINEIKEYSNFNNSWPGINKKLAQEAIEKYQIYLAKNK